VGFISLQGFVCRGVRSYGVPAVRSAPFRAVLRVAFPTVPRRLRSGFIPSCVLSSSEFLRLSPGPLLSSRHRPAVGFLPSSRRPRRCPLVAGAPNRPLRSVPRFLQPLDGLLHLRLCGLISSRCHVQGSPFRGFSRPAAVPTRRRPFPPCPCRARAHRLPGCHALAPELRGLAPQVDAFVGSGG
jgi:hypothetical protein